MIRKWLISLTPGENEYEDVIVNGPFVGDDEQALERAIDDFMDKRLAHSVLVSSDFWILTQMNENAVMKPMKNWVEIDSHIVETVSEFLQEYTQRILTNEPDVSRFREITYKQYAEWLLDTVKHISPDYALLQELDISDPQELHRFYSKAGIVHAEMMIDGEKWHYHHTSDDEFQIYHEDNLPTFYVVPGSAADTPEDEIRCEECGARKESWLSTCSVCGFTPGSGGSTSPGYSEACGVWD